MTRQHIHVGTPNGGDPIGPRSAPVMATTTVRVELARFADAMERKLTANDHKAHWRGVDEMYLVARLRQELNELTEAYVNGDPAAIQDECCDVANFAMMVFDVLMERRILEAAERGRSTP